MSFSFGSNFIIYRAAPQCANSIKQSKIKYGYSSAGQLLWTNLSYFFKTETSTLHKAFHPKADSRPIRQFLVDDYRSPNKEQC